MQIVKGTIRRLRVYMTNNIPFFAWYMLCFRSLGIFHELLIVRLLASAPTKLLLIASKANSLRFKRTHSSLYYFATMATMLSSLLPAPIHLDESEAVSSLPSSLAKASNAKTATELANKSSSLSLVSTKAPPYGSRKGWIPSKPEDYADGGAL